MLQIIPTKNNYGVKIMGDYGDLYSLYSTLSNYFYDNNDIAFSQRARLLTIMSYDIRHAYQHERECEKLMYDSENKVTYYGCYTDWITLLFSIACLKCNLSEFKTSDLDRANVLLLSHLCREILTKLSGGNSTLFDKCLKIIPVNHRLIYFFHQDAIREFCSFPSSNKIESLYETISFICDKKSEGFYRITTGWEDILRTEPNKLDCYEINDDFTFPDYSEW